MKAVFFVLSLLLGSHAFLNAQAFNLPVSTTSEKAKAAYEAATYLGSNLRMDAARMEVDKALEADPNFFMAYIYASQVYATTEEKPALLDKALAIDPSGFNEAEKIMRQQVVVWKDDPQAVPTEAMKSLVAAYPTTPEAYEWAYLHAAYTEQNMEAALAYAQKLMELDPNHGPVYNFMGYYYLGTKEMDKAKTAFEKYLELAPAEANAHDSMGEYYQIAEDYAKAAAYYDQAAALGMESSQQRAEKARALIKE